MSFARKAAAAAAASAFFGLLLLTVFLFGLNSLVTKPDRLKSWLRESKAYETFIPALIDETGKAGETSASSDGETGEVPLENPEVRRLATDVLNPAFVQNAAENVIDGIYPWLEGEAAAPTFSINLADAKTEFADKINAYLKERAAGLPVCTADNIPATFDPFTAQCLPPAGIDVNAEIDRISEEIRSSEDFLPYRELNNETLTVNKNGEDIPVSQAYSDLPGYYQRMNLAPLVSGLLAVLAGVAVFLTSSSRRRAIKQLSIILAGLGGFLLISILFINRAVDALKSSISGKSPPLEETGLFLAEKVGGVINGTSLLFGIIFLALAGAGAAYLRLTRNGTPKGPTPAAQADSDSAIPPPAATPETS